MSSILANVVPKISKLATRSFFSITALSMLLFFFLNVKLQTVLDDDSNQQLRKVQIVFEFPHPFTDNTQQASSSISVISHPDPSRNVSNMPPIQTITHNDIPLIQSQLATLNDNDTQTQDRQNFSDLFTALPHACVMEQECHLYLSDIPFFTDKTLVVIGMVRDSEDDIIATLQQLDEISCLFSKIVFIFYESNSKDNTPFILEDWSAMYVDGSHCHHFEQNPSSNVTNQAPTHRPILIRKILFHDFVDVRGKNRIVRFIIFRNMLLEKIDSVTKELGMAETGFDYVMMIDLDIKEFAAAALLRDLHDSKHDVLCSNGLFKLEIMRDTFASVMTNGTWLYTYHSLYDDHFVDLVNWPYDRYQPMNSCFGGLAVYKSSQRLLGSGCRYSVLEELKTEWEYAQEYRNSTGKERAWPEGTKWFMKEEFRRPLIGLVDMFLEANIKVSKERRKICEHLAYHYCLRAHGYNLAISRDSTVYYFDFARMANNPI